MTPARALWWGAGVMLALAGTGLAVGESTGWPWLRQPLQDAMARATGVPVTLDGPFHARLLSRPQFEVGHLKVGAGAGLPLPHLLDASGVTLQWRWSDLWHWRKTGLLRLQSLQAQTLDAHLLRLQDGRASWQLGAPEARPAAVDRRRPMRTVPSFGRLQVGVGHIVVDDRPMQTLIDATLRGGEGDALPDGSRSGYEATLTGRYRALPLKLQARSGGALPLMQDRDAGDAGPTLPLRVEGQVGAATLLFDGQAGALIGERRLTGSLRFRGPSLAPVGEPLGLTLPQTPPFDLSGQIDHAAGVWRLQAHRIAVGRSLLNGDFRYDTRLEPGRLSGRLSGPRLALADLAPAIGKSGPAPANARRVLPQRRFDLPSLKAMDADLQVAIDELDFGGDSLAPLQDLRCRLLLDHGVLRLQGLKAAVAGGQFSGSTSLDANAEPAQWAADLGFAAVDVAGWVRGIRTPRGETAASAPGRTTRAAVKQARERARQGGDQPVQAYLTGALTGRLKATGAGRSTAEILGTLNGDSQMSLRDGTLSYLVTELAGLDVAQALGVLIVGDKPLPLRCARMDLVFRNGVVEPRVAVLDNADSTLRLGGRIDLRDETLALRATSRPKDFSPLALRTPITVTGTLSAPVVGVDGTRLAGKLLGVLALGAVAGPAAALLPLVDTGTDDKVDPCAVTPAPMSQAASTAGPRGDR